MWMRQGNHVNDDPDGFVHTKAQFYLVKHPQALFRKIQRRCFEGKDMNHEFTAISPRSTGASKAETCQIFERKDYLEVFEPWYDFFHF